MSEPLTMDAITEGIWRSDPTLLEERWIKELDATRAVLTETREQLEAAQEGCRVAYQYCAHRGASEALLDNLSAAGDGDPLPHKEWAVNDGKWKWDQCGHFANTVCEQCLTNTREQLAQARKDTELLEWLDRYIYEGFNAGLVTTFHLLNDGERRSLREALGALRAKQESEEKGPEVVK